jgi:hypothetical protein
VERHPCGDGRTACVQRLFFGLAQDVGLLLAFDAQLVLVGVELGRGEEPLRLVVAEPDPLKPEKDEGVLDLGPAVARESREVVRLNVGGRHAEAEVRVDLEPRELLLEVVDLVEQRAQPRCVELVDVPAIPGRDVVSPLDERSPLRTGLIYAPAQVAQVPANVLGLQLGADHARRIVARSPRRRSGEGSVSRSCCAASALTSFAPSNVPRPRQSE